MTMQELRKAFLGYFEERGHLVRPSAPLVLDDPTTLFTSAGVQPYVPAFRGEERPPAPTVASCQKCARMGDLDGVGRKARYHTFFEMLGNFSFGDYFKEGGIHYAWEFLTEYMNIPADSMWVTIFETDDEAEEIWHQQIGVPQERIIRFGREDNWWPKVRWEGPCGPCTEVHVDLGPEVGCGQPDCRVGCDCDRWLELWNVVFQQYTEAEDGTLTPLPKPGVDTGMGLERLGIVMQGTRWSAETDELKAVMDRAAEAMSEMGGAQPVGYGEAEKTDLALRVIADHVRAIAFLMADGATPSNVGPGYVLRRLIRRAHRFGRSAGATAPFLYGALPRVAEVCGQTYPELLPKRDFSARVVHSEEERFGDALDRGLHEFERLRAQLEEAGETVIPGEAVFGLMATYGLPVEVTEEMAEDAGLSIDRAGFEEAAAAHGRISGAAAAGLAAHGGVIDLPETEFVGYETTESQAEVLALIRDGERVDSAETGDSVEAALDRSPFYAERGGQVGDTGEIRNSEGGKLEVTDVVVGPGDAFLHRARVAEGTISVGDAVTATVDGSRRRDIMRHHTATHLLQAALRKTLGEHVTQQGSLVAPDRLRFDFTHHEAMSPEELATVEDTVNRLVLADIPVAAATKPREQALAEGAIALFGDKYEDTVRVVQIGSESAELCGGTHCPSTGTIGSFRVVSEGSAAANVRRIEAVCGMSAVHRARQRDALLAEVARAVGCRPEELPERVEGLRNQLAEARKTAQATAGAKVDVKGLLSAARQVGGARLVVHRMDGAPADALKGLVDELVARGDRVVALVASVGEKGKVRIIGKADEELVAQGAHAGNLVREVAKACGGGGGGKPTFAEAGGKDAGKLDDALALAPEVLAQQLGG
jgi:alanyl-tRNA synthetase